MKASVIIPSYNAYERLYYTLIAFNQQNCSRDKFEVIVIDNGSTDHTAKMLSDFKANYRLSIISLPKVKSRAYARNQGILKAKYELIIFHDSDMLPHRNYINMHLENHTSDKLVVCGNIWNRIFTYYYNSFNDVQKYLFDIHMKKYILLKGLRISNNGSPLISKDKIANESYQKLSFIADSFFFNLVRIYGNDLTGFHFKWLFFVTRNCSVRKQSLLDAGLFDESFEGWGFEDTDMGFRLQQAGYTIKVNPNIISTHQEHPVLEIDLNAPINNKDCFLKKHDDINALLYFLCRMFEMDENQANEVMGEILRLSKDSENGYIIDIFRKMLIMLRNIKVAKQQVTLNKDLDFEEEVLKEHCIRIIHQYNASNFVQALLELIQVLYNIKVEI